MDPTLSLLMSNQALVKNGDLVFDPFVGSGSLLVAAAKCGGIEFIIISEAKEQNHINAFLAISAYVLGTDIDYLMLHGKTKPTRVTQKVRTNIRFSFSTFKNYFLFSFLFHFFWKIAGSCTRRIYIEEFNTIQLC